MLDWDSEAFEVSDAELNQMDLASQQVSSQKASPQQSQQSNISEGRAVALRKKTNRKKIIALIGSYQQKGQAYHKIKSMYEMLLFQLYVIVVSYIPSVF